MEGIVTKVMVSALDSLRHQEFLPCSAGEILTEVLHQFERIKLWHSHDPRSRLETEVYWKDREGILKSFFKGDNNS